MPQFYANPKPIYQPAMRIISSITNASSAVVTTNFANQYAVGIIGRLDIPPYAGMPQANQLVVTIIQILGPTSFAINLDTTTFQPFAIPDPLPAHTAITAMFVPVGEVNKTLIAATQNILPYSGL